MHLFAPSSLRIFAGLVLFISVGLLSSCIVIRDHDDHRVTNNNFAATEAFRDSMFDGQYHGLHLSAIDGPVNITGESNLYYAVIYAIKRVESESMEDAQEHLNDLQIAFPAKYVHSLSVGTLQPEDNHGRRYVVDYDIRVPLAWDITVEHVNGDVILDSLAGDVVISLANGAISMQHMSGNTEAHLSNGSINCTTVLPLNGTCSLQVINGPIDLGFFEFPSAYFIASAVHGSIVVHSPVLHDSTITPTHVEGTFGNGDGHIILSTINGNITVDALR